MKGELIGQGGTSEVFAWGEDQVLKLFRSNRYAQRAEREVSNTRMAHEAGLTTLGVSGMVEIAGRPGIIYERISGPSMLERLRSRPWRLVSLANTLARCHAAVHERRVSGLPSQRQQLEGWIRDAATPAEVKDAALRGLDKLPEANHLCHGDVQPGNVLMSGRGPILIDWDRATIGNPLADVAMTLLMLHLRGMKPVKIGTWAVQGAAALFRAAYLRRYLQLHQGSRSQIEAWQLPIAVARVGAVGRGADQRLSAYVKRVSLGST